MAINLQTKLCNITLQNPFILASGIWGTSSNLLVKAVQGGAGAVTTKSVALIKRSGHENPVHFDWGLGLINAMGLPGDGVLNMVKTIKTYKTQTTIPIIASICGKHHNEFMHTCKKILESNPDIIEINMSCPNIADEHGTPFACDANNAQQIIAAIKTICPKPLFAKLAPNVPHIRHIAKACVEAGADGITAINTVPGMIIDIYSGKPILSNKSGGLSGPAIKPIALKAVYDIRKILPHTPIIGTGGITNGIDAIEMLMAGATAVGIGSAIYYNGNTTFKKLKKELLMFFTKNKYKNLNEIKNKSHL
jgi:dihydroorotate dehydrogenase (NAD+) catalytic subunit